MTSTSGIINFKRSMNGIVSLADGSGTNISNGNITCNTFTANNQSYCPVAPNSTTSLTNKSYVDSALTTAGTIM